MVFTQNQKRINHETEGGTQKTFQLILETSCLHLLLFWDVVASHKSDIPIGAIKNAL